MVGETKYYAGGRTKIWVARQDVGGESRYFGGETKYCTSGPPYITGGVSKEAQLGKSVIKLPQIHKIAH